LLIGAAHLPDYQGDVFLTEAADRQNVV
jgi:hypothetical protein